MIWYNCVGSLSGPSTGHILMLYSRFLIDLLLLVQKWANSQYQAKAWLQITYIELKHIHWKLKRKSWMIALRSHNFVDRLHDSITSNPATIFFYFSCTEMTVFSIKWQDWLVVKKIIRKQWPFFLPLEIKKHYDITKKYCDVCFI